MPAESAPEERRDRYGWPIEWGLILLVGWLYCGTRLLDFNPRILQISGEHSESATLPILAEIGVKRYHEIPLWNPYMLTGFPHAGDLVNHFWNPVSTVPVVIWGGVNGMKVSVFLAFLLAGLGQWVFARVFGLRGPVRLWAAVLFMISGGLAILWRIGWYELLLGAALFPWCFAAFWVAMHRRDRRSIVLAAVCVALVLASGGGYYPFYLAGCALVLVVMAVMLSKLGEGRIRVRRALAVGLFAAGLSAVVLVPWIDGRTYTVRDRPPEREQPGSQPIPYALINYVVSDPAWLNTTILGTSGGFSWFYMGWLPLAAAAFAPLAFRRADLRPGVLTAAALTLFLLAWNANKFTPFKYLYQAIPFFYNLRFPGRLLVIAASPLIVLGGLGLQHLYDAVGRSAGDTGEAKPTRGRWLVWFWRSWLLLILLLCSLEAFRLNQQHAFAPWPIDPKSYQALEWLKAHDSGAYYVDIGDGFPEWGWMTTAYTMEIPVINFKYNRHVKSQDAQREPPSPFFAKPKYLLLQPSREHPVLARRLKDFDDWTLWEDPDALPFAFSIAESLARSGAPVRSEDAAPLEGKIDGPNRVIVRAASQRGGRLVVLVSDYPGWKLTVDGVPAAVVPVNGYLGASLREGTHEYRFRFAPRQFTIGALVSIATLLLAAALLVAPSPRAAR